jgi:hypothetical protein
MLSVRVGALSSGSSVKLKSPIMKSVVGSDFSSQRLDIVLQNSGCEFRLFGA